MGQMMNIKGVTGYSFKIGAKGNTFVSTVDGLFINDSSENKNKIATLNDLTNVVTNDDISDVLRNDDIPTIVQGKQDTLVDSGENQNLKTVNGESLLGKGNIEISSGADVGLSIVDGLICCTYTVNTEEE